MASLTGHTVGLWPVMPYRPRTCLTQIDTSEGRRSIGIHVEISVDSGANWHPFVGGYKVLPGRLGIWICRTNLASMPLSGVNPKGNDNLFQRLVDNPAHVLMRMTCTVASPARNISRPARRATAGTAFGTAAWFDRGAAGQVRGRVAGSTFHGGDRPVDSCRDADADAELADFAAAAQDCNEDRFIEATLPIEWIATEVTLGSRIQRISGIEVNLQTNAGAAVRSPRVVARTFHLTPDTYDTQIVLDTDRKQVPI